MDFGRASVEKLAVFISALIPGGVAIYIYYLANPKPINRLFMPNSLGYGTKIGLALAVAFVIGTSLSAFFNATLGAVGGAIGARKSAGNQFKWPDVPVTAPWRDPKWRGLAKHYLGEHAPKDTLPLQPDDFNYRMQSASLLPAPQQAQALLDLNNLRLSLASDDFEWSQWYTQIQSLRLTETKLDFESRFSLSLRTSLQVTAAYILISMFFVPELRSWGWIAFIVGWTLIMFAETYTSIYNVFKPWNGWFEDLHFLTQKVLTTVAASNGAPQNSGSSG